MRIEIRRADVKDAEAIAEIIKLAFEDNVDLLRLNILPQLSHHYTFVAVQSGQVVGFVDNFLTVSQQIKTRLELDLLAVHPQFQGRGIAKQLIQASVHHAKQLNISSIRALVATNNRGMQKACTQVNLTSSEHEFSLYVQSPTSVNANLLHDVDSHLICVDTLTYTGLWLEGVITNTTLNNAHIIANHYQLDTLGAIVDTQDNVVIDLLKQKAFVCVDDYQWWMLNLGSD